MKDTKFSEPVPCTSLNEALKHFGACFDVPNRWQSARWQSVCIFDNLVI